MSTVPHGIRPIKFEELERRFPHRRPPIINGLAREGEVVNLIGPPKVNKSMLIYGLALSILHGKPWLEKFETVQGKVAILDNELCEEEFRYRVRQVANAMKVSPLGLDVFILRREDVSYENLAEMIGESVLSNEYRAVFVDSHYKMLPDSMGESDPAGIRRVYRAVGALADVSRAVWTVVHHPSKGDQSEKQVTDIGAGSGVQSRACDTHLVLRPHETEGCYVLEAAVRSFPPLPPLPVRWEWPVLSVDLRLDPSALRSVESTKASRGAERVYTAILNASDAVEVTERKLRKITGLRTPQVKEALTALILAGRVMSVEVDAGGNLTNGFVATCKL